MLYKCVTEAKSGKKIPVLRSGRTMESRYDPEKEASRQAQSIDGRYRFFLVAGIGSAILLRKLAARDPDAFFLCVENDDDDLAFVQNNFLAKDELDNCVFTTVGGLREALVRHYIPALYGDLKLLENPAWLQESGNHADVLREQLQHALGEISADFSVQSHFGKIWQHNILSNLRLLSEHGPAQKKITADTARTAAVIAAGPSLDRTVMVLAEKRSDFYIIATDTAYGPLLRHGIIPDALVSIDGQHISQTHFLVSGSQAQKTDFFFDACANSSAARHILSKGGTVTFFSSGHPLADYAGIFPRISSGSGTVTISATELAKKFGFCRIQIFGADFGYSGGKAYAKGTYLDTLYHAPAIRTAPAETAFDRLLFRTPLLPLGGGACTTQILSGYKKSLEEQLSSGGCSFTRADGIYFVRNPSPKKTVFTPQHLDFGDFICRLKSDLQEQPAARTVLLPYIAYLRTKNKKLIHPDDFMNLALSSIVGYN